ncbi:hypothetical protein HA461_25825 (plasmid) [Rhizobium leguminosarum bv. trifolii]|uniref:hypothetical protein n=1 Tax=Rhizobium leguminosarum TaxID=384 RepID=UPI00140FF20C|nr:hypothetical protein [Rhizobium leguminosarum]QIO54610.1 hypothetical protein HA461_25825 [Rhizobium leguminosarum bv. trifolii]
MFAMDDADKSQLGLVSTMQPVSGRFEGEMTLPHPGRSFLDLRVDVDISTPNSLSMNRISGDFYQIFRSGLPGQPQNISRTFIESWIVDLPVIEWHSSHVVISGEVRYWSGTHAKTTVSVQIEWNVAQQAKLAAVTFTDSDGLQRGYTCRKTADVFRALEMEIDVCQSVSNGLLLPLYHSHGHPDRPADLPERALTIERAYHEAGVAVSIDPSHTVIDDTAAAFQSWTPAELHDAMETHFSRFGGTWPSWAMWGLMAGAFERPTVGGIMFDAAAALGGAGQAPERQGFAVFRKHSWFQDLVEGEPQTQEQAWAARHFLYTWVHEAGHAFNHLHSWDKGRPDSLSWMNYDWRYDQRNGADTFWKRFPFRFDDDELIHIRHGNRASVIMGGDPWSSGSHMDAPNLSMAQLEGSQPVEFIIRSKRYFEFMDSVIIELRLRNLLAEGQIRIDQQLAPEFGAVVIYIQKPDGRVLKYEPVMCALATPELSTLAPLVKDKEGPDRYSREVFISYGANGFYFDQPGDYKIRAIYQGLGDVLIPSNRHTIRIGVPIDNELDRLAQDYFSDAVGLTLYLQGSRSLYLESSFAFLRDLADRRKGTMLAANIGIALAHGAAKPFHRIEQESGQKNKLKQTIAPNPELALDLTDPALATLRQNKDKALNLAYARVVRRRAEYHKACGDNDLAGQELTTLARDLSGRGANPNVVKNYEALASSAFDPKSPSTGRTPRKRRSGR